MKKFSFIIGFVALLALCSCNKAKNISVDSDKVIFTVAGGEKTVTVTADGNYDVQDCPEWLKAEKGENSLSLTTEANTTGATRDGVIHLVGADGVSVGIAVVQPDKCTHITASPAEVTIPKEGGSVDVAIETDGADLNVEVGEGIQANYTDGKLTLTAPANEGGTKQGTINLTCDEQRVVINYTIEGSICQRCGGKGTIACSKCGGKGYYTVSYGGEPASYGCRSCGGSGSQENVWDDLVRGRGRMTCPDCGGAGH